MYPQLSYINWPCSAAACWALLLLAAAAQALHLLLRLLAVLPIAASPVTIGASSWLIVSCSSYAVQFSVACMFAAVGFKAVDMLFDVLRAFHPIRAVKLRRHRRCYV
jgi:hypothetical protein